MEFDKSRIYTSINADELKFGDKVIVGNTIADLMNSVENNETPVEVTGYKDGYSERRISVNNGFNYALAYMIERRENCTNCACHCEVTTHPELDRCENWKSETETCYRPFRDVDELIKVWDEKLGQCYDNLEMPYIWVRHKGDATDRGHLITRFSNNGCSIIDVADVGVMLWETLFDEWEFLDGTPCGVEE